MKTGIFSAGAVVLALTASWSSFALGQARLQEVVVVGSRFEEPWATAPTAVQLITKEDIQRSGALSFPDALRMLGGVNVRSTADGQLGLSSGVDLGGFGVTATQNTLIIVDGRRLNPIDASDIAWSVIPLSSIQRIEIAQAAAGVQYGAGATGGVIHVFTDKKTDDATRVGLQVGSFGTAQADFNLERQFNDLSLSINAGANRSDGWRENSQGRSQNAALKVKQNVGAKGYVFAEVLASQQSNGFAGGVLNKVGQGDQQVAKFNNLGSDNSVTQSGVRLGAFTPLSLQTSLDVDVTLLKKSSVFKQPYYDSADSLAGFFVSGAGLIKLDGDEFSFSPKVRTEFSSGISLVYGYDFSLAKQNGANAFGNLAQQFILANQGTNSWDYKGNVLSDQQSVQLRNQAAYLISRIPLNQDLDLSLGARRQIQSFDSSDLNKTVGTPQSAAGVFGANAYEAAMNFKFNEASRTYLRVNQSYRFANTDEYWGNDVNFNRVFAGELRPQTTRAFELGFDHKTANHQFSVMFGQSVTQDEIRYIPAVFHNTNSADNIFRSSVTANWATHIFSKSRLSAGVRFQKAEYVTGTYAGQTLSLVPNAIYNLGWTQALDGRSNAGVQMVHVSKQNYDASPGTVSTLEQMPAYTTVDLFWARNSGKLETKVTIKNLMGSTYSTYGGYGFVSTPGGNGMNSYYYYPSDPRSLYVSMTYRF
jgi:iron complex outermembrane receptor protein